MGNESPQDSGQGAVPNSGQDTGQLLNITEGERNELRGIVRDTPDANRGQAIRDFWAKVKESRAAPQDGAQERPGERQPSASQTPPDDARTDPEAAAKASEAEQLDNFLREKTDGAISHLHLDVLGEKTQPLARRFEMIRSTGGDEALGAELDRLEDKTLADVYGGSEEAMAAGVREISQAAMKIGGQPFIDEINATGVLADPDVHRRALVMARSVLGKLKRAGVGAT